MLQEFTHEVERTARAVVNEIHTALPGKIISVDEGRGTASIQPCGKYVTSDGKSLAYPVITEVPLVFPFCQQSGAGMIFPVCKGDSCVVVVSEVELDEWRSGAESEGSLRFDLSNAIAIPGLFTVGEKILSEAMQKNAVIISDANAKVVVARDNINVGIGDTHMTVSERCITVRGDLNVEGNISYTGNLIDAKSGEIRGVKEM